MRVGKGCSDLSVLPDERIPIAMHLLLGACSIPLLAMIGLLEYKYFWSGAATVFVVCFSVSLYWIIATRLQNPSKSAWLAERVPAEWHTIDVDAHFELDKDKREEK